MNIQKTMSVILSVMIVITTVFGCFAVTANAESTVMYSYVIDTDEAVNAFEGEIHYPKTLSVKEITFDGQKNEKKGKVLFNTLNVNDPFIFSGGKTVIAVEFNVNGEYNAEAIYGKMTDFCSTATIDEGNVPFDYTNVVNGEVVSCGHTDIDNPVNSYEKTKYSVTYRYKEYPESETLSAITTKPIWSELKDPKSISEICKPKIDNPYYTYSVDSADFTYQGSKYIIATLSNTTKKYSVIFDEQPQGEFAYLDEVTVNAGEEKDFSINGIFVARGESFTFFVTGDTDITTNSPTETIIESATLVSNALYVSDNPNNSNSAIVKMEMIASAVCTDFLRMGVAFAGNPCSANEIRNAVNEVTTGTGKSNHIAVHNSKVDNPNVSGQYQFIYAPYVSVSKVSKDKSLYFYSYVVNKDGTITLSEPELVSFSNVLA